MDSKPQPIEDAMKNLKVDPSSKLEDSNLNTAPPKVGTPSEATSFISSSGDLTGSVKGSDADQEYLTADQGLYYPPGSYYGYYYPGYDGGPVGEFDDQGYYLPNDGLEFQYSVR